MTRQEIFDIVWHNILKQGGPSFGSTGCAYRGDNGRRCAVGWLILDDDYKETFEGNNVFETYKYCSNLQNIDIHFLKELQVVHDNAYMISERDLLHFDSEILDKSFISIWKEKMKEFAVKYKLNFPE